jgi:hypothetical protein
VILTEASEKGREKEMKGRERAEGENATRSIYCILYFKSSFFFKKLFLLFLLRFSSCSCSFIVFVLLCSS